ncbi:MAG TPA: TVP38/TMEM64 family protein [archaeon]|nr:TVP38/TMEM64 family protein [archaeon]
MSIDKTEREGEIKKPFITKLKIYLRNLFDFSQYSKKTILYIILFVILIAVSLFLLYYIYFVDNTILYRFVVEWFVNPVFRLGILGFFLFVAIMGLQGLLVPLPSELILLATGMIWGIFLGGIMGVIGSMAAGLLCYYVSRLGGRPLAEKIVGEKALRMADNLITKYGTSAIIVARFLPFVAFDPISYASGLVNLPVKKYSLGTLIGSIPRAFFYSFLGASLGITPPINFEDLPDINAQSAFFNNVLLIILAVLVLMFIVYYLVARNYEKKNLESKNLSEKST